MRIGDKIVKEEEGLDELVNYMFFNNKILKLVKYATQLMTQGQKNTLITELRLIKKQMERDKENG
jgi:hypothetical protein